MDLLQQLFLSDQEDITRWPFEKKGGIVLSQCTDG
jgi:hypothetical protein